MPITYRRPGVYLEESLLVNPADTAGSVTVACFIGAAGKGPINDPILCESWSSYVTMFGDFSPIPSPEPIDPNDITLTAIGQTPPETLVDLQNNQSYGSGWYTGPVFTKGQYVTVGDDSPAQYVLPALATAKGTTAPGQRFASEVTVTASNAANAALLTALGYIAAPTTAWADGQSFWIENPATTGADFAFYWGGAPAAEVQTISKTGTITNGTYDLTVLGTTATGIAYNANAAAVQAALDAALPASHGVVAAGGPLSTTTAITLTYAGTSGNVPVAVVNATGLTGSSPVVTVVTTTPGSTGWTAGTAGGTAKYNNGTWEAGKNTTGTGSALPVPAPVPVLSYLPHAIYSFFQNGGRFAWVIRSVSGTPGENGENAWVWVNGSDNLATELHSFKLVARSVGSWGDNISYQLVHQPPIVNGEAIFSLRIMVRNTRGVNETVENWSGLTVRGTLAGTKRVDAVLNDAAAGSQYVRVTDLNTTQPIPVEADDSVSLDNGLDPSVPDASDLISSAVDGVPRLEGPVTVNIAGYIKNANEAEGSDPAAFWVGTTVSPSSFPDRQDIIVVNDSAPPRAPNIPSSSYKNVMQQPLRADAGSSYSASYGPWIIVPNPSLVGRTIAIPPGGAVMGMMARIDATAGVFRAPAGVIAGLNNAVGVQAKFTDSELGDLNANNINIIRSVVGAGICCMGGRTRKSYGTDRYISARRTLIYIKEVMRRTTQFAVFENNDQRLWSALRMSAERVLRPLWEAGGLRGESAAQAYYIRCDSSLNTLAVISSGEVRMELGVALEYPAEFVIIRVTQFDQGTFSTEVQPSA